MKKIIVVLLSLFALLFTGMAPATASLTQQEVIPDARWAEDDSFIPAPTPENTVVEAGPQLPPGMRAPAAVDVCVENNSRRSVTFSTRANGTQAFDLAKGTCYRGFKNVQKVWTGGTPRNCEFYLNGSKRQKGIWIDVTWWLWVDAGKRGTC